MCTCALFHCGNMISHDFHVLILLVSFHDSLDNPLTSWNTVWKRDIKFPFSFYLSGQGNSWLQIASVMYICTWPTMVTNIPHWWEISIVGKHGISWVDWRTMHLLFGKYHTYLFSCFLYIQSVWNDNGHLYQPSCLWVLHGSEKRSKHIEQRLN